eukprot:CFRG6219T1
MTHVLDPQHVFLVYKHLCQGRDPFDVFPFREVERTQRPVSRETTPDTRTENKHIENCDELPLPCANSVYSTHDGDGVDSLEGLGNSAVIQCQSAADTDGFRNIFPFQTPVRPHNARANTSFVFSTGELSSTKKGSSTKKRRLGYTPATEPKEKKDLSTFDFDDDELDKSILFRQQTIEKNKKITPKSRTDIIPKRPKVQSPLMASTHCTVDVSYKTSQSPLWKNKSPSKHEFAFNMQVFSSQSSSNDEDEADDTLELNRQAQLMLRKHP